MKDKSLLKYTVIFFLIVNTSHFWEGKLGLFAMVSNLILIGAFLILGITILFQIRYSIKEEFENRERMILIGIMSVVLICVYCKPRGIIDFNKFEGKNLFVAERTAGGNCYTKLQLKENLDFIEKSYCFGVHEVRGKYEIKEDSVFFKDKKGRVITDFYKFGIIQKVDTIYNYPNGTIFLYESGEESNFLFITENGI